MKFKTDCERELACICRACVEIIFVCKQLKIKNVTNILSFTKTFPCHFAVFYLCIPRFKHTGHKM